MGRHAVAFFGILIGLIVLGLYGFRYYTKSFSPEGITTLSSPMGLDISVEYSRPHQMNRKLFGNEDAVVKYGKLWRTGANEATEITINKDVEIHGKLLKAGQYTLFTIPNEITWTIIFNNELDQWGSFNYNANNDALRVVVPSYVTKKAVEVFTIEAHEKPKGAELRLLWGNVVVTLPMILQ